MEPGNPERYDTQYERNGVSNLFMIFEPLAGWRHVEVTDHRTAVDWAHQVKKLVDGRYSKANKIVLVQDNLNTHTPASLYKAFSPEKPLALKRRTGLQTSLSFITRPNTGVGWIWLK